MRSTATSRSSCATATELPRNSGARFSRNAATPSRKSSVCVACDWSSASSPSCSSSVAVTAFANSFFVSPIARVGAAA